jgi:hypothetical protein
LRVSHVEIKITEKIWNFDEGKIWRLLYLITKSMSFEEQLSTEDNRVSGK